MKSSVFTLLLLFPGLLHAGEWRDLNECTADLKPSNQKCLLLVEDLRPTQFAVGMKMVKKKREKLEEMDKKERHAYLLDHPVPLVIGPKGDFFAIDHHHLARALYEAGHSKLTAVIRKNWSNLKDSEFWQKMKENNFVYPFDETGHETAISDLPRTVRGLKDDPYRSIAALVREAGCYKKSKTPFAEFRWAEFFRTRIKYNDSYKDAVKDALALCHTAQARGLPGYTAR